MRISPALLVFLTGCAAPHPARLIDSPSPAPLAPPTSDPMVTEFFVSYNGGCSPSWEHIQMKGTATSSMGSERATLTLAYDKHDRLGSRQSKEPPYESNTRHTSSRAATVTQGADDEVTLAFPPAQGQKAMQWRCTRQLVEVFPASATALAPRALPVASREVMWSCRTRGSRSGPLFYLEPEALVFRASRPVHLRHESGDLFQEYRVFEAK